MEVTLKKKCCHDLHLLIIIWSRCHGVERLRIKKHFHENFFNAVNKTSLNCPPDLEFHPIPSEARNCRDRGEMRKTSFRKSSSCSNRRSALAPFQRGEISRRRTNLRSPEVSCFGVETDTTHFEVVGSPVVGSYSNQIFPNRDTIQQD